MFDHRYPTSTSDNNKTRRYFWILVAVFAIFLFIRVLTFPLNNKKQDDVYEKFKHRSSDLLAKHLEETKNHHHLKTGGVPNRRPNEPPIRHEIIHDQLVQMGDEPAGKEDARDAALIKDGNVDTKAYPLGMKGERLSKFFTVEQKNGRKKFHVAHERKRMFDQISDPAERNEKRRQKIREEMKWAWNSYKSVAWGYDELHSVTRRARSWVDGVKGFAMTIFDSLDTLYLMNHTKEFNEAVTYLSSPEFDLYVDAGCSTFEATIRLLGGTLSSYELSNDIRLLRLAEKVGWILIAGLETSNGMLEDHVNFKRRTVSSMGWLSGNNLVSELGSLQIEFRTLSFHLKDPIFDMRVTHLMSILRSGCEAHGFCCPTMFNFQNAKPSSSGFTLGGMADSYFEYIVKQYVLTGGVETELEHMATEMMKTITENMILQNKVKPFDDGKGKNGDEKYNVVFPGVWNGRYGDKSGTSSLEHLTCFAGGMFAEAALNMKNLNEDTRQRYAQTAHDLTETCVNMYFSQNTGLAPEEVMLSESDAFRVNRNEYRLRPETVESVFYMWRITGDEMYREWAWDIFDALMRFCKMPWGGYSGILDVNTNTEPTEDTMKNGIANHLWDDLQQSYFMAETMKYLYLTFADPSIVNLEEWVFNTESHPVRIRQRDPRDIWYDWKKKHDNKPRWIAPHVPGVTAFYPELDGIYKK